MKLRRTYDQRDLFHQEAWICLTCREFIIDEEWLLAELYKREPTQTLQAFRVAHYFPPCDLCVQEVKFLPEKREAALTALCEAVEEKFYAECER